MSGPVCLVVGLVGLTLALLIPLIVHALCPPAGGPE